MALHAELRFIEAPRVHFGRNNDAPTSRGRDCNQQKIKLLRIEIPSSADADNVSPT
jgi:hypothetical protein